jgi:glycosyltransferase involved in cell wall biosynthesis
MTPALSVILPVYNAGAFLDHALRSVLRQPVAELEVIAVDDGSSDATPERLAAWATREPRLRVIRQANAGPAAARNRGLAEASAPLVGFIDADDLWPADKLAAQLARLRDTPSLEAISGFTTYFDRADETGLEPAADSRRATLFHVHLGATLFRSALLRELGGFDPARRFSEDQDLWLRLREAGSGFVILRQTTLFYRRHGQSMTAGKVGLGDVGLFDVLRDSLARRRAGGPARDLGSFTRYLDP